MFVFAANRKKQFIDKDPDPDYSNPLQAPLCLLAPLRLLAPFLAPLHLLAPLLAPLLWLYRPFHIGNAITVMDHRKCKIVHEKVLHRLAGIPFATLDDTWQYMMSIPDQTQTSRSC